MSRRNAGHVDLGCTGALILVVLFVALAPKLGWAGWPWWGKTLYGAAMVGVLLAGAAFEQGRTWTKDYNLPPPPPKGPDRE